MKEYSLIVAAMDEEMNALLNLLPNLNKISICNEMRAVAKFVASMKLNNNISYDKKWS